MKSLPQTFSICAAFFLLALQSCSTTRIAHAIEQTYEPAVEQVNQNTATFPLKDYDLVWESVISFFASNQIPIETVEKDSGIVVAKKIITSSSGGGKMADLGLIVSKRWLIQQSMVPTQFAGSANIAIVRSIGRIAKEEILADSVVEIDSPAIYALAVQFNVFVSRFSESELRVTFNVTMTPSERIHLYQGWSWYPDYHKTELGSELEVIAGLVRAGVPPTILDPWPVSTGTLERSFLDFVRQYLASK